MRKTITTFLLLCLLLASALTGCGDETLPGGTVSRDAAKLLLASERLNPELLSTQGDIFENGVEVMNNLANTAIKNLNAPYASDSCHTVTNLTSVKKTSTVLEGDYSGKLEIDGDTFIWSEFKENNNSYDAFKNITDNIVTSANIAANLIDSIKKNVRVVDKWVNMGGIHYYLSVGENFEILCQRDTATNSINVCRRYKNEDGKDVYELYSSQEGFTERMFYIPSERYELSMINDYSDNHMEDYFVADNSKGYWETYIVGALPTHYNVSYFIMKNDICYDAFYNPEDKTISLLKVMSGDKATDIINFSDHAVSVKFSGFDGVDRVEASADSVSYFEGEYATLDQYENATVYLTNGKTLNYNDSFAEGKVTISAIHVGYSGLFGYTGEIDLNIQGDTDDQRLQHLKSFLNEVGLKCKRNIDSVFAGIHRSYVELDSIVKYYTWNGISVVDESGIGEAINIEKTRINDMAELYTAAKEAEVLDFSDTEQIEMNIKFAPITSSNFDALSLNSGKISVNSISLSIEDTTLFVEGEPYKIMLALANENGGLIHVDMENPSSINYTDSDSFTVTASQLNFSLPELASGNYTPVAYIATSDGIRASAYTPVTVSEIVAMPIILHNMTVSATKSTDDLLTLTYARTENFEISITTEARVGYEEFKNLISKMAFKYGTPSNIIELISGDIYTELTGEESEISDGTYRILYKNENGNKVVQGYIYVIYSCK